MVVTGIPTESKTDGKMRHTASTEYGRCVTSAVDVADMVIEPISGDEIVRVDGWLDGALATVPLLDDDAQAGSSTSDRNIRRRMENSVKEMIEDR